MTQLYYINHSLFLLFLLLINLGPHSHVYTQQIDKYCKCRRKRERESTENYAILPDSLHPQVYVDVYNDPNKALY